MSSRTRRFFWALWRANAVLIFLVGVLGSLALAFVLVMLLREATRTRHASDVLNVADREIDRSKASLGNFEPIGGTPVLRAELSIDQEYESGSFSKGTHSTQNYLYYDASKDSAYWLMPDYKGLILANHDLPASDYGEGRIPPKVVLYELIDRDTNSDGKLTENDLREIAIADPAGKRLTRALKNVEEFNGAHLVDSGSSALVFYTMAQSLHVARIDLASGAVLRDLPLKTLAEAPK